MTEDFLRDTRAAYDAVAEPYTELFGEELADNLWDGAFLDAYARIVRGPVLDVGCGPGRVTAYLDQRGLDVSGVDLSPGMVAAARRAYPELRFVEGSMTALDVPDASLGGVVAWYSVIHVPDDVLPAVLAEFHRVLVPGGHLALAFQVGDEPRRPTVMFGAPVALTFHRRRPDAVADLLARAGLPVRVRLVREPEAHPTHTEETPQAYLLARKPTDAG
ncbi:class I SAM-dependent methyltransferase [Micromonospora sp. NPDC049799]|uniref:class I SAM-dependent DNA methyltransferase n=1 Tax=Micromonospora sp. NPDC049799 TaxID=3154741 RepID=UPI0033F9907E